MRQALQPTGLASICTQPKVHTAYPICVKSRCRVQLAAAQRPEAGCETSSGVVSAAWVLAPALSLLGVSPAHAAEGEEALYEATEAVMAAVAKEQSSYDLIVSIMFGGVVACLSVVTLGVAYLSLKQFLDAREEEGDKTSALMFKGKDNSGPEVKKEKESDVLTALPLKKSFSQTKRDKTKGFGGGVATTPKEF